MTPFRTVGVLAVAYVVISGCVAPVKHEWTTDFPAPVIHGVGAPPVIDGRLRFREIFCHLLAAEPDRREFPGPCESYLLRLNDEPLRRDIQQPLPDRKARFRVLIVPGFLDGCFSKIARPFQDAIPPLEEQGYRIEELVLNSRASNDNHAASIARFVENLDIETDERLVLIGHSSGASDILHFLVDYPQVGRRVAAVVSVAGAVNGSRLGGRLDDIFADLARNRLPYPCDTGGGGAFDSMRPAAQLSWLAANPLPSSVRYVSIAAFTKRDRMGPALKNGYDALWIQSPRNDGILLIADQIIPGGILLGYANADHLSVAMPLENSKGTTTLTKQAPEEFPRKVLLQATLIYLEEVLQQFPE